MPVISVEYDSRVFSKEQLNKVCLAIQVATAEVADESLEDSPLTAREYQFALNPAPMEVYIRMSESAIPDGDAQQMLDNIKQKISAYKEQERIAEPINIMLIPMRWELALNV